MGRIRMGMAVVAVLALVGPASASSQGKRGVPIAETLAPICRSYVRRDTREIPAGIVADTLTKCLRQIADHAESVMAYLRTPATERAAVGLRVFSDSNRTLTSSVTIAPEDINAFLIKEHGAYQDLSEKAKAIAGASRAASRRLTSVDNLIDARDDADENIHDALAMRGLNQAFSASLVSGPVLSSGDAVEAATAQADESTTDTKTDVAAHLVWESKHFGKEASRFDFSFRGKLGFLPALQLVEPRTDDTPVEDDTGDAETLYQEAFVWDVGARFNVQFPARNGAEFSLTTRAGQTVIGTQSVLVERGGRSELAIPIGNGAGNAEWFYEVGTEFQIYNNPLDVVHMEGSAVSPIFLLGAYVRKDNRFRKEGDLAAFGHPDRRAVFRFMIDALRVIDNRDLGETPRTFSLGFGVDHEVGFGPGEKVPAGTKFFFRGDLDLLRALRGR